MAITNCMTFKLGFRNEAGEIENYDFSVYYDRTQYDDPKDVAIDHYIKIKDYDDTPNGGPDFSKLVPLFGTFEYLNDRVPSDLQLGR